MEYLLKFRSTKKGITPYNIANGIWKIDVNENSDNRVYHEVDHKQVIKWLEKRVREERIQSNQRILFQ